VIHSPALLSVFSHVRQAYQDGDAVLFNNIGAMIEPITRDEFNQRPKQELLGNSGHGGMSRAMQSIDAGDKDAKGILGRLVQAAQELPAPMKCNLYSITGAKNILEGILTPNIVLPGDGIARYRGYSTLTSPLCMAMCRKPSSQRRCQTQYKMRWKPQKCSVIC
jgi:hypothetical protein